MFNAFGDDFPALPAGAPSNAAVAEGVLSFPLADAKAKMASAKWIVEHSCYPTADVPPGNYPVTVYFDGNGTVQTTNAPSGCVDQAFRQITIAPFQIQDPLLTVAGLTETVTIPTATQVAASMQVTGKSWVETWKPALMISAVAVGLAVLWDRSKSKKKRARSRR